MKAWELIHIQWYVTQIGVWNYFFAEECIKLCTSEGSQMGVKGILKHKRIQDIVKISTRHIIIHKKKMFNTWILRKTVGFKKNIKKHGLLFHYNIRSYPMLGIGHFSVIWIQFRCSAYLRKLYSPCNIGQDIYTQVRYKVENQQCFFAYPRVLQKLTDYSLYW